MDYACSQKRNKSKDKFRDKKKHPYKKGGRNRLSDIHLKVEESSEKKLISKKNKKKSKKK